MLVSAPIGSVAAEEKCKRKGRKGGGRGAQAGRMTEEEEDARLLASANSKRRVVRLEHQPKSLAKHCQMHPYQLEGLNWLIKLHDQ
jgi:SNF2 family DNA or RNA helicase